MKQGKFLEKKNQEIPKYLRYAITFPECKWKTFVIFSQCRAKLFKTKTNFTILVLFCKRSFYTSFRTKAFQKLDEV